MSRSVRLVSAERGTGTLSSALGLLFFLGFLTLTTQLTTSLYRTSLVSGVAYDAAHAAAGARLESGESCDEPMLEVARERAAALLGATSARRVTATCVGPDLQIAISLRKPALLALAGNPDISRTIIVRSERVVDEQ